MFTCGWCGHAGVHGEVMPSDGSTQRCSQCPRCVREKESQEKESHSEGS